MNVLLNGVLWGVGLFIGLYGIYVCFDIIAFWRWRQMIRREQIEVVGGATYSAYRAMTRKR